MRASMPCLGCGYCCPLPEIACTCSPGWLPWLMATAQVGWPADGYGEFSVPVNAPVLGFSLKPVIELSKKFVV